MVPHRFGLPASAISLDSFQGLGVCSGADIFEIPDYDGLFIELALAESKEVEGVWQFCRGLF
jgi:hypothetical protein